MARVGTFLIVVTLIAGTVGCSQVTPPIPYDLTISSTEGGSVTMPGEGTFTYNEGEKVNLAAIPSEGYQFVSWTGDVGTVANVNTASTTITMNDDYSVTATFAVKQYNLVIHSTEGGSVTTPGEDAYTYEKGKVVNLVAVADEDYQFINWTGDVSTIPDVEAASTTITMNGGYSITANFAGAIRDWYDFDAIRYNLGGSYVLMNDLDYTTSGYVELAGPMANGGKGWQPIGDLVADPVLVDIANAVDPFTGEFDGKGYEVSDLFISRSDEDGVALFASVNQGGIVEDLGVVNAEVTGHTDVGGLVGVNDYGTVRNSYSSGSVIGHLDVGGLVGANWGTVSNCYFTGSVTSNSVVGGLAGYHAGIIDNSYSSASITGQSDVGGLVGHSNGAVSTSHSTGSITGESSVGGLVGLNNWGSVSNSYYNYDEVLINGENLITIGALFAEDFEQWLANDKFLDVNERFSQEGGYYVINSVSDFKQLLAFGQDASLKFRLQNDLNLANEANFYIPYLAGEFDGNGRKIRNLSLHSNSVRRVGLFGFLTSSGRVSEVGVENADITATEAGGLVGTSFGTVSNSYYSGSVTGSWEAGGLVGELHGGTVRNSYCSAAVTGHNVGGLVGWIYFGTVSNSYYNYDEVLINGENLITIGALFGEDFEQWLTNDKFLDVNERFSQEGGYYVINNVSDLKELLAFGQNGLLKFRLKNDLDLGNEANFYIPYLAGEFDGNGHKIYNLSFSSDCATQVGLFGFLAPGGRVSRVGVENANIIGFAGVGNLVGWNDGTVSDSYASGSVAGSWDAGGLAGGNAGTVTDSFCSGTVTGYVQVGGLIGENWGEVGNSYSTSSVSGDGRVGGLVGWNKNGTVSNCYCSGSVTGNWQVAGLVGCNWATVNNSYSTSIVTGDEQIGGLVGRNWDTVGNSFWDVETSQRLTSAGGTGKTTAEMKSITTFSSATWNIITVANPSIRNTSYIWNMVDGQTYPFLSWQS